MAKEHNPNPRNMMKSYQSPEEIHKHFMFDDIKRWQQEIEIVNMEMIFYKNLLESHMKDLDSRNSSDFQDSFNAIKDVQHYNNSFQIRLQSFIAVLKGLNECDDLQCEHHFLDEHAKLRMQFESHFGTYKNFKKKMLSFLKTRYNY